MDFKKNILLRNFTTFRIGGAARFFVVAKSEADLREAIIFAKGHKIKFLILGGGSNLLISDKGFSGLVIKNEIKGIKFIDNKKNKIIAEVGSGEILDDLVSRSIARKLSGLENLSGIPGTVGGAAVQNAGAYGVEIKDLLLSVSVINTLNNKRFTFNNSDCQYGYRKSFFKKNKKYIITSARIQLNKKFILKSDHSQLKNNFKNIEKLKAEDVRELVLKMRREKLPDLNKIGTAGSFFVNPIIANKKYNKLKEKYFELPGFPCGNNKTKVSLAWILDKICNLKGFRDNNVGLYDKQPLVLINYGQARRKDILIFARGIKKIIKEKTGIEIKMEVEKIN